MSSTDSDDVKSEDEDSDPDQFSPLEPFSNIQCSPYTFGGGSIYYYHH